MKGVFECFSDLVNSEIYGYVMTALIPSATIVLIRNGLSGLEVLMLRRSDQVRVAGGAWVFPGGKIDCEDHGSEEENIETVARRAATRELEEETQLKIEKDDLLHFSHWTTPVGQPKRFSTWFFVGEAHKGNDNVQVCGGEILEHRWYLPEVALADHRCGRIEMLPPTFVTLTELSECSNVAEMLAMYRDRPIAEYLPKVVHAGEVPVTLLPGDSGYDSGQVDASGARHRIWRYADGWRLDKS